MTRVGSAVAVVAALAIAASAHAQPRGAAEDASAPATERIDDLTFAHADCSTLRAGCRRHGVRL